jgi:hypothetical protein
MSGEITSGCVIWSIVKPVRWLPQMRQVMTTNVFELRTCGGSVARSILVVRLIDFQSDRVTVCLYLELEGLHFLPHRHDSRGFRQSLHNASWCEARLAVVHALEDSTSRTGR